jgi:hypothetical protein
MRRRVAGKAAAGRVAVGLLAGVGAMVGAMVLVAPAANAAGPAGGAVKPACPAALPAADRQARPDVQAPVDAAAVAAYKSQHPLAMAGRPSADQLAATAEHDAAKTEFLARTKPAVSACAGSAKSLVGGTAQISWMYQYAQVTSYFCGPAVVSEMSATVPGTSPYNLDQTTVANYMGTNGNGTSYSQETVGLNHYVGVPDFNWNFYGMAWLSNPPTAAQNTDFVNHLAADVAVSSPIAGLAYEVPGGPHLVGHPVNQSIGHWFEIGGYSPTQVWYADSATSVWSSVPRYSWFSTSTMEIILGGAGYIW